MQIGDVLRMRSRRLLAFFAAGRHERSPALLRQQMTSSKSCRSGLKHCRRLVACNGFKGQRMWHDVVTLLVQPSRDFTASTKIQLDFPFGYRDCTFVLRCLAYSRLATSTLPHTCKESRWADLTSAFLVKDCAWAAGLEIILMVNSPHFDLTAPKYSTELRSFDSSELHSDRHCGASAQVRACGCTSPLPGC